MLADKDKAKAQRVMNATMGDGEDRHQRFAARSWRSTMHEGLLPRLHCAIRGSIRARCISAALAALNRYRRGFTGHVAHPVRSILARRN